MVGTVGREWSDVLWVDGRNPISRRAGEVRIVLTGERLTRRTVVETIIASVRESLIRGDLHPGQKLPSEQQIAVQFGVGRGSVREAMKMLSALGVITIHQGDGTYIADAPSPAVLESVAFALILQSGTTTELLELREAIEIAYTELAALKLQDADIVLLESKLEAWRAYAESSDADPARLAELDLEFHDAIIAIAANPLISRIASTVEHLFFASVKRSLQAGGGFDRALAGHLDIVAALKSREPDEVRRAVRASLKHWHDQLRRDRRQPRVRSGPRAESGRDAARPQNAGRSDARDTK
jgi:GntR family transcriptional regulator, transcriptional repressor for pyruvate dehydrogenase complex